MHRFLFLGSSILLLAFLFSCKNINQAPVGRSVIVPCLSHCSELTSEILDQTEFRKKILHNIYLDKVNLLVEKNSEFLPQKNFPLKKSELLDLKLPNIPLLVAFDPRYQFKILVSRQSGEEYIVLPHGGLQENIESILLQNDPGKSITWVNFKNTANHTSIAVVTDVEEVLENEKEFSKFVVEYNKYTQAEIKFEMSPFQFFKVESNIFYKKNQNLEEISLRANHGIGCHDGERAYACSCEYKILRERTQFKPIFNEEFYDLNPRKLPKVEMKFQNYRREEKDSILNDDELYSFSYEAKSIKMLVSLALPQFGLEDISTNGYQFGHDCKHQSHYEWQSRKIKYVYNFKITFFGSPLSLYEYGDLQRSIVF